MKDRGEKFSGQKKSNISSILNVPYAQHFRNNIDKNLVASVTHYSLPNIETPKMEWTTKKENTGRKRSFQSLSFTPVDTALT